MLGVIWTTIFSLLLLFPGYVQAQTATYHLHKEASTTSGLYQLKTAGPDATATTLKSANLKGVAGGEYLIKAFDTQSGVPNVSGVIPAGSTVTFTLWMNKSANYGTMYARAKLRLNNGTGTLLCTATGSSALTTTLTKYTLTCTTTINISMTTSDRFYLWAGVNLTATPTANTYAQLSIEGTLNGNYDSQIVAPLPTPPPTISSLSPTSGPVGTSVTINGSNFRSTQGNSTVTFNGTAATPNSWTNTTIVTPVPAGATTGPVVVTVGGVASNQASFTVSPKINSLSPTLGPVGILVTISGTSFGTAQGTSNVTFNGVAATPSSWNDTSIVASVPTGATTGSVVVTVGGAASNGATFTVTPKINSLSPTSGPVGASVIISGSSFGTTQGTSTVIFNGIAATPSSWSDTGIVAPVPLGATTGPVVVTVGGVASNGVNFTVAPKINSLSPTSGPVGTSVTISGSNFGVTQGTSTVTFNGTVTTPTSWGDTSITAPVPLGAITGSVVVTVGGAASNGVNFTVDPITYMYDELGRLIGIVAGETATYTYDAAGNLLSITRRSSTQVSIIDFTPKSGPVGTTVTIYGTGFSSTPSQNTVTFNGVAATVLSATSTQIVTSVPSGAATGLITVTSPSGSATSSMSFTVGSTNAPTITGFTPNIGTPGTAVTITGTNFETTSSNNKVTFNITLVIGPSSATATSLATNVPSGATSGHISVATPVGKGISTGDFFVPPSPYTAADVELTSQMTIGETKTVTINTAYKIAMIAFDGTAGQQVSLGVSSVTFTSIYVSLYNPDGTALISPAYVSASGSFNDYKTLPVTGTYTILVVTDSFITTVAGTGMVGSSGDGGPATNAQLNTPWAAAVDGQGNLFIAESLNHRIRKVNTAGIITTVAGNGTAGYSGDTGLATSAQLNQPTGVAVDNSGNLFIADSNNNRVRKVDVNGTITTVAGTGVAGFSGDDGPATNAQLNRPWAVAVDSQGNLLISDQYNYRVRKISLDGIITTVAGNGNSWSSGDGGPAISASFTPYGIAVDNSGNLFIAAGSNYRIRRVDVNGMIITVAGTGVAGFSGDGGPATSALLKNPTGVAVDNQGNLFIADSTNLRVRKVNASGIITTMAGNGGTGYTGDGGPATKAEIGNSTVNVALDGQGNLLIVTHHKIRKVVLPSPGSLNLSVTSP